LHSKNPPQRVPGGFRSAGGRFIPVKTAQQRKATAVVETIKTTKKK
jgi:hypothetical protein